MPGTIAQGSSQVITVNTNTRIGLNSSVGSKAYIEATSGVPGSAVKQKLATHDGGFAVYGPFGVGTVTIFAASGSVFYDETDPSESDNTKFPVVYDPNIGLMYSGSLSVPLTMSPRKGSMLKRGFPLMRTPNSSSGFTAESGNITITQTKRNNRNCLELSFAALTGPHSMNFAIPSRAYSPNISMVFEVENAAQWNGGNFRIGLFTDGTFANGVQYQQNIGAGNGFNGIRCVAPMNSAPAEWAAVGTGTFASTMAVCRLRFTRSASPTGITRVWLYEIAEDEAQSLPAIYIGADDGHMTWYNEGLPILEKYGFQSYLAYIADDQDGVTRMRDSVEWADAVINRKHRAVVHGCMSGFSSLRDYLSLPDAFSKCLNDISYMRDRMVSAKLDPDGKGRRFYVIPQGNIQPSGGAGDDTIVNAIRAAGMVAARRATVENGLLINGGTSGMSMYLPIIGHSYAGGSESTNISNIVARMQAEIAAGRSVILMFHEVRAVPSTAEQITPANLETIVAAAATLVKSGSARMGDIAELVDELSTYSSPVHVGP